MSDEIKKAENKNQWYTKPWMLPIYIVAMITILALIIENFHSGGANSNKQNNIVQVASEKQTKAVEPAKPLSEEDRINQIVVKQLNGKNNLKKDYIREIKVTEQIDGGWGVFVEYNADEVLSSNSARKSIQLDMSKIYTALYTSGENIQTASVSVYFPVIDKYGNPSDAMVYKTMLEKTEADKVNWSIDKSYLGLEILPNIWETVWLHSEFKR